MMIMKIKANVMCNATMQTKKNYFIVFDYYNFIFIIHNKMCRRVIVGRVIVGRVNYGEDELRGG